jgi:L-threonylcarbamoyladenylate synthase
MITQDLSQIQSSLCSGNVVGIPTETVYGLAANIFNDRAIELIFETKKRPNTNPLIVHVHSLAQAKSLVEDFPMKAIKLAEQFWPGPLTLILPKKNCISDLITANQPNVAIRIPDHPLTLQLLASLEFPLAAPSANPANRISPTSARHVEAYFPEIYTLDGGDCQSGVESTILSFEGDEVVLLRHGAIAVESIEDVVGRILNRTAGNHGTSSPGSSKKHYSPLCDLIVTYEPLFMLSSIQDKRIGILWFTKIKIDSPKVELNHILAPGGTLDEAARNIYEALHQMEQAGLDLIIVERLPSYGLGRTINDRLERAASK